MANTIKPFKIAVLDLEIEALKAKLVVSTFPKEASFSNNLDYGVPLSGWPTIGGTALIGAPRKRN